MLNTKELVLSSLFSSMTAILAQISIPLLEVAFTMQVFIVALCGLVLGKRLGFISQIIYILLGLIGLPVFTHFRGGVGILLGPTGGFILSFPIIAFTVGYFSERFKSKLGIIFGMVFSLIISLIVCFTIVTFLGSSSKRITLIVFFSLHSVGVRKNSLPFASSCSLCEIS